MTILHRLLKNKEILFFTLVLLLGTALRLYRLPQTMQFLGDQGRDALIARRILIEKDPAFIGPVTSVGNMYLGPLYYYFMVFPLMLTYPSPVGPAVAVAVVGILTLALIYILGSRMIGRSGAMIAMYLYSLSPTVIENVRFSWNPNIVPFFSLIAVWATWMAVRRQYSYWVLVGVCAAALFQLHYIALILIGGIGLVWLGQLTTLWKERAVDRKFVRATAIAVLIFLLSLLPLFIFDTKHDWLNVRAFLSFFHPEIESQSHFRSLSDGSGVLVSILSMFSRVVSEFFGVIPTTIAQKILVSVAFGYLALRGYFLSDSLARRTGTKLLLYFLCLSVVILSLYNSSIFDHYLGFVFPIAFLCFGYVLVSMWRVVLLRPLALCLLAILSLTSIASYPGTALFGSTVAQFGRSSALIADSIPTDTTFNLLSYSPTGDLQAMNYRYFLTTMGKYPADPDDWTSFSRLYIIDEEHRQNPLDESQYVISTWPNRTIIERYTIPNGPNVYVLERN